MIDFEGMSLYRAVGQEWLRMGTSPMTSCSWALFLLQSTEWHQEQDALLAYPLAPSKDDHYQSLDSYLFWRQVSPVAWISFNARWHFQEQVDFITATDPSTLLTSDVIPHCVARWNHNWASVAPIIMLIAYSGIIYRLMFCSATDGRAYSWHHKREQLSL